MAGATCLHETEERAMRCRDVMLTFVYRCEPSFTAAECARLMRDERIGFVPVVDNTEKVIGVVTDRDLAIKVLATGKPSSTPVGEVMSSAGLVTCRADDDLQAAEEKMARTKKGRILVLDEAGHCVGVISLSDIARVEEPRRSGDLFRRVRRQAVEIAKL
jgi:CBS domain-containing protein